MPDDREELIECIRSAPEHTGFVLLIDHPFCGVAMLDTESDDHARATIKTWSSLLG